MKSDFFTEPRYWYHLTDFFTKKEIVITPRDEHESLNRPSSEPKGKRTCVAPTITHCLLALTYFPDYKYNVYRTKNLVIPKRARGVDDSWATHEGWLLTPTEFVLVGGINLSRVSSWCERKGLDFPTESATKCHKKNEVRHTFNGLKQIPFDRFLNKGFKSFIQ